MTKTMCYSVTRTELGNMIKRYLAQQNHRYGGITYIPKHDTFRLIDVDGETTIDDILKDAFGMQGYTGYSTKVFPKMITAFYTID